MGVLEGMRWYYSLFGPIGVWLGTKARLSQEPIEIKISATGVKHPLHLRLRTSDELLFSQIIVNGQYDCEFSQRPRVIIDAGANIGLTSVFYANKYPEAKVIAIEPGAANFEMLQKNTTHYPNILTVQGALWKDNQDVYFSDPGQGDWGLRTGDEEEPDAGKKRGCVRGLTLAKLMAEYSCNFIDILKIDIEGSEKEVFETSAGWINQVGVVVVELHDRLKAGCSRSVYLATKDFDFEWQIGPTIFFVRKDYAINGRAHQASPSPRALPSTGSRKLAVKVLSHN